MRPGVLLMSAPAHVSTSFVTQVLTLCGKGTNASYIRANESSGATTLSDSSGNGNPATITGTLTLGGSAPASVGGTSVSGFSTSNYATISNSPGLLNAPTAFTLGALVNTTSSATAQQIESKDNSGASARQFQFRLSAGKVQCITFPGPVTVSGATALNDGTWRLAVATWDGSTVTVYANGSSDGSAAVTSVSAITDPLYLGYRAGAPAGEVWAGSLDEMFMIANYAATPTEIANLQAAL